MAHGYVLIDHIAPQTELLCGKLRLWMKGSDN